MGDTLIVKTANTWLEEAKNQPKSVFVDIGLKFICERKDKQLTTWHCTFDKPIEDIINEIKYKKKWIGGKFLEIYLEFENKDMKCTKYYLDINISKFNLLLQS